MKLPLCFGGRHARRKGNGWRKRHWRSGAAPSDAVPEYVAGRKDNYPVAYVPNAKPSIKAVFMVRPWFVPCMTVSSPRSGYYDDANPYLILDGLPEAEARPQAGGPSASGGAGALTAVLQSEGIIPRVVRNNTVTLPWRIESMANVKLSGKYWEEFTTTKHEKVYTLLGAPQLPWKDGAGHGKTYPWFGALEFVIGPAKGNKTCGTAGATDAHEAMRKITKYLFDDHDVKYETKNGQWAYATLYRDDELIKNVTVHEISLST